MFTVPLLAITPRTPELTAIVVAVPTLTPTVRNCDADADAP